MIQKALFLLLLSLTYLIGKTVRPPILVEKEPIPAGIFAQYSPALGENKYHQYNVHVTPIIFGKSENFLFFGNIGLMGEEYNFKSIEQYRGVHGSFLVTGKIKEYIWHSFNSLGEFSDSYSKVRQKGMNYLNISLLGYEVNPRLHVSIGAFAKINESKLLALPLIKVNATYHNTILDMLLPSYISVLQLFSEDLHLVTKAALEGVSFYNSFYNEIINVNRMSCKLSVEKRLYRWSWLSVTGAYVTKSTFTLSDRDKEVTSIKAHPRIEISYTLRPN